MQGLPGSGKSTRAEEIVREQGNTVRVGRDQLRTMLHFDRWTGRNERITKDVQMWMVAYLLEVLDKNVIVDDTNIQASRIQAWRDFAKERNVKLEWVKMDTPLEECIRRDAMREKPVGKNVIVAMAMQAGIYPKPKKGFVICDLDGTLCDVKHRLHFVQKPEGEKKDWKGFFVALSGDSVRTEVMDMLLNAQEAGYEIAFVSGRPDEYRPQTEAWLEKALEGYEIGTVLLMRRTGDKRPDTEVKKSILDTYFLANDYHIEWAIDDRPSVIRMWRENNISVTDVGDGVEF